MSARTDFLFELGCEELPATELPELIRALKAGFAARATEAGLPYQTIRCFATPRRLAVLAEGLALTQEDKETEHIGPPTDNKRAQQAFAAKHRVGIEELSVKETPKGARWALQSIERGRRSEEVLPALCAALISELPISRRMRWGAGKEEFLRPIRWLVMLLGEHVVPAELFGLKAGNCSRGHRFLAPGKLRLKHASTYAETLRKDGFVIAEFDERRAQIRRQIESKASEANARAVINPDLLDEVTGLTEWPAAICGAFEPRFLELPETVLMAAIGKHQRCFPLRKANGSLQARFIAIANIDSKDVAQMTRGNERVIRPRLEDAAFFYANDRKKSLSQWREQLSGLIFQNQLGTMQDKTARLEALLPHLHHPGRFDLEAASRAARLAKADLMCAMVQEFETLQGVMGGHYAACDGESAACAEAIAEHYRPRFTGDELPQGAEGRALAIADRLDTLTGIFSIGEQPSGSRDPFALRRAASGVLGIVLAARWPLDLRAALQWAASGLGRDKQSAAKLTAEILDFINARFVPWCEAQQAPVELLRAVLARLNHQPLAIAERVLALNDWIKTPKAAAVVAANKRIANILKKQRQGETSSEAPEESLYQNHSERALATETARAAPKVAELCAQARYEQALGELASVCNAIDEFFEQSLVMDKSPAIRDNRLALLATVRALFEQIADFSQLPGAPRGN